MTDKKSISNYLKILINGILMGTANKIPGVSGGLVAIAIGFYEELSPGVRLISISLKEVVFERGEDSFVAINFKNQIIERSN